jgi:hypothetical protein
VSSLTVEGNAASLGVAAIDGFQMAEVWAIANGTATPDIVATWTGSMSNMGLGVIAATGVTSLTPNDTATDPNHDPLTGSVDVLAGGIGVGVVMVSAVGDNAWSGITEFYDSNIESPFGTSGAYDLFVAAQTVNVSVDIPNNRECLALAAYR